MMVKKYARFVKSFLLLLIVFFSIACYGQADTAKALRLFLIGNSFSQNATRFLPQMAKEGGVKLTIGRAELGGCTLQRHWELVEAAEANDPKGKAYNGKSLKDLLSNGKWDIITIQQASVLSGDVNTYRPYAQKLYDYVKKLQPGAEVVIHQTWAYRSDAPSFTQVADSAFAKDAKAMWQKSRAAYHTIAGELAIRIIPVGDAFWKMQSNKRTSYRSDKNFDVKTAVSPNLPDQTHSLHAGYRYINDKLDLDTHHANDAGCYLGGLVWYSFLFHVSPDSILFKPATIDEAFAKQLKKAVSRIVSDK